MNLNEKIRQFANESATSYRKRSIQNADLELSNYLFWVKETLSRYQLARLKPDERVSPVVTEIERCLQDIKNPRTAWLDDWM